VIDRHGQHTREALEPEKEARRIVRKMLLILVTIALMILVFVVAVVLAGFVVWKVMT
jgi:t-SNARE complex subunit (syntaxin)